MAHFAQLDENNTVIQVLVIADKDTADDKGVEKEEIGIAFCKSLFGEDTKWVQTSYNNKIRNKFAGIGDTYDKSKDKFIPKQIFSKWILNDALAWVPPIPTPDIDENTQLLAWNDEKGEWVITDKATPTE